VRDILVTHSRSFKKGRGLEGAKRLLGEGLLTSEGQTHLRQRRLIQPAFHRDRLVTYASTMSGHALRLRDRWTDGGTIDVAQEMMRLTLGIVGKTLFGTDVEAQAPEVGRALTAVMQTFWMTMLPFFDRLESLRSRRRARPARAGGARSDHLRDDRRAPAAPGGSGRPAVDAADGAGL
jgi:cytochrome P450